MMPWLKRWTWPILKALLALAILLGVGRQFARDLRDLPNLEFRITWLILSAAFYLLALGFSARFWFRLLRIYGETPNVAGVLKAYYVGQLGKYVPGKAWALLLRGSIARQGRAHFGTAIITAFYEVLTTMATGALLAAIVFVLWPPRTENMQWHPVWTGLLLLGVAGLPLLPGVFNVLTARVARRFSAVDSWESSRMSLRVLFEGMLTTSLGWALMGVSLWCCLAAVLPETPSLTPGLWIQLVGVIALAYVAGFLVIVVPGGVGVREYFLTNLLAFLGPEPSIVFAVILMRLAWTTAELLAASAAMLLPAATGDDREK